MAVKRLCVCACVCACMRACTKSSVYGTGAGNEMIGKLLKMQMMEDDDELAYTPAETETAAMQREADGRPGWMRILSGDLLEWSKMLPKVRGHSAIFCWFHCRQLTCWLTGRFS